MKSACVGVLFIIELKNARWNIEITCHVNIATSRSPKHICENTVRVCVV